MNKNNKKQDIFPWYLLSFRRERKADLSSFLSLSLISILIIQSWQCRCFGESSTLHIHTNWRQYIPLPRHFQEKQAMTTGHKAVWKGGQDQALKINSRMQRILGGQDLALVFSNKRARNFLLLRCPNYRSALQQLQITRCGWFKPFEYTSLIEFYRNRKAFNCKATTVVV